MKAVQEAQSKHRRYPTYRPSGVDWLGDIPTAWGVAPLKWFLRVRSGEFLPNTEFDVEPSEKRAIPVVGGNGIAGYTSLCNTAAQTVVLGRVGALCGNVHFVREAAWVTDNALIVYRVREFDLRYLVQMLREADLNRLASQNAQPLITGGIVKGQLSPLPPLPEQRAIAAFLDRETKRIDELVAKKRRLIELLEEKRNVLISHAVTKGLDPSVPMKDSGIEWLGEIPAHWGVMKLGFCSRVQSGLTLGKRYETPDLAMRPYLRVANVQDGFVDLAEVTQIQLPQDEVERYELRPGDVLMTEGGDFDKLGRGCVWRGQVPGCLHQNHVFAVRPAPRLLLPDFLAALTTAACGKFYFTSTSQQTTNLATTNRTKIKEFPVPVPPIEEQWAIAEALARQTSRLDALRDRNVQVIDKLKEYRTALISAAVTGKIDVREEVAQP